MVTKTDNESKHEKAKKVKDPKTSAEVKKSKVTKRVNSVKTSKSPDI